MAFVWQDHDGTWRAENDRGSVPENGHYAWNGRPWALRCDTCLRLLPYGCVLQARERRTSPDQARENPVLDEHGRRVWTTGGWPLICGPCEEATARAAIDAARGWSQLDLWT